MAANVGLPEGFEIDNQTNQLPPGFTLDQTEEPGFIESAVEMVTGAARATPQTEALPELSEIGIRGLVGEDEIGKSLALAPALLTATDPNEIANIITSNYPDVGVTYNKDAQGNVYPILRNNKTGAVSQVNRPGMSALDVIQGLGIASALTPAGRAGATLGGLGKVAAVSGASGATSTGLEAYQAGVGGEFDIVNVLIDTIAAGALEAVPALLQAHKARTGRAATRTAEESVEAEAARIGQDLSPEALAARQEEAVSGLVGAAEATGRARAPAVREFAEEVMPDEGVLTAARELGIEEQLLPSHYSTNQSYIEVEQGLASIPGSKLSAQSKDATRVVAQEADKLITEFGGTTDKSALSQQLKERITTSIDALDNEAEVLYRTISDEIPKTHKVNPASIIDDMSRKVEEYGGEEFLEPLEKRILNMAKQEGGPTYALLDKERKKIGQALGKLEGPYKTESASALKDMYRVLTEAQEATSREFGLDDVWQTAKGLVSQRKELENQSIKLLGRDKTGAIMPKVGIAMKKLSTGDYKDFDEVINALPKDSRQEVILSSLNDVFTMGSRAEKQLSAPGFVDWMEGLNRNRAAKARIYKELPEGAATRLENIFKVARGIRNASKERITTGRITALLDNFANADGMVSKLYQTGKRVAAAEGVTTAVGIPGAGTTGVIVESLSRRAKDPITKAADNLLSSPEFQAAAKRYASSTVRTRAAQQAADKALAKSERAKAWVELLPSDAKREIARVGLLTYLGGE